MIRKIQIMKIHRQYERAVCGRNFTERICNAEGADFNTLGASNTLGSYVGYAEYSKNYTISCRELDEDAFYQCVIPIPGPDGAQNIPARAKVSSTTYITVKALQEGKLERILQFFDYVYSDEGIELTNYGIEGTNLKWLITSLLWFPLITRALQLQEKTV